VAERDIDVASMGIIVADVFGRPIDEWPQRGRLSLVKEMGIGVGGCAANAGIDLVKLGLKVSVVGRVGDDGFALVVRRTLEAAGVDVSHIATDPEAGTSGTMVMVHGDGERSFIHYPGANGRVQPADMPDSLLERAKIVLLAGTLVMPGFDGEPAAQVLRRAKEAGAITCLDTVWDATGTWMKLVGPMLPHADMFLPSIAEAAELTDEIEPPRVAAKLMEYGPKIIALKQGEQGCYIRTPNEEIDLPAYDIEPVDGTGAGDAFVAGFLRGYLAGWPLERIGQFACATGAMATLAMGTTAGVGNMEGTLAFMEATRTRV
jgi:sugar/nucleoside kinase (ribokinase family)